MRNSQLQLTISAEKSTGPGLPASWPLPIFLEPSFRPRDVTEQGKGAAEHMLSQFYLKSRTTPWTSSLSLRTEGCSRQLAKCWRGSLPVSYSETHVMRWRRALLAMC